jgi:hypothetical protein
MEHTDIQFATEKLQQLKSQFSIDILPDWGPGADGNWQAGTWLKDELERLHRTVDLLAVAMGGSDRFINNLNGVTIKKADIGTHGGEALHHRVSLSTKGTFTAWTVVHELAHAWDANHNWQLSVALEKYTGGYTSRVLSFVKKALGHSDSGLWDQEDKPGRHGRLPGCNAAGYFYGDFPSGSNWAFNRVEDFAESVAMYVAWKKDNDLSEWAESRVNRYILANGANAKNFGVDNWADYKRYFYPVDGDYTKTKRWQFVDELVSGKIQNT